MWGLDDQAPGGGMLLEDAGAGRNRGGLVGTSCHLRAATGLWRNADCSSWRMVTAGWRKLQPRLLQIFLATATLRRLLLTRPHPSSPQIAKKGPHTESATVGRSASYKRSGKW